jgi:hypothetical protein
MDRPTTACRDEWRAARTALVEDLTRLRDQFSAGWCERLWAGVEKHQATAGPTFSSAALSG